MTGTLADADGAYRASIGADFPHFAGDFEVRFDDRMIQITAREPRISLSRDAIQQNALM